MANMRACFLGQSICALGFGVATLQTPPLLLDERTGEPLENNTDNGDKKPEPRPVLEQPKIGLGPL
ncbi:MAG TPA: hypothetical protein VGM26_09220 [Rhizomicrobium sp.]